MPQQKSQPSRRQRLVIGLSGASGALYGVRLLQILPDLGVETHLVISKAAERTLAYETPYKLREVKALAHQAYEAEDVGAAIASGSFRTAGMIVAPCSMRSAAEIACGTTASLLTRAADVTLKEKRRLVLMVRETPLHSGHLATLLKLSEWGAVIAPPVPAFYAGPKTLEEMLDHSLGRVLDLFGLESGLVRRWGEQGSKRAGGRGRAARRGLLPIDPRL